jgi:hypothetical protein
MLDELNSIDPKSHVEVFRQFFSRFCQQQDFADNLLSVLHEAKLQQAASWLLHQHLKSGGTLTNFQLEKLLSGLNRLNHWVPILYHLQMLDYIQKPSENGLWHMEKFVRKQLISPNHYVKAWAFQGFSRLVDFETGFREELVLLCREKYGFATASAQARIRAIAKRQKFNLN